MLELSGQVLELAGNLALGAAMHQQEQRRSWQGSQAPVNPRGNGGIEAWPNELSPQHHSVVFGAAVRVPHAEVPPTETVSQSDAVPTRTGDCDDTVVPIPNCPKSFAPQQ